MIQHLLRMWRGEIALPRMFWDYGIICGTLLNLVATLAALAVLASGWPATLALATFLLPLPYTILVVVGVWRSAAHYRGARKWADLARIAIVVWGIIASIA